MATKTVSAPLPGTFYRRPHPTSRRSRTKATPRGRRHDRADRGDEDLYPGRRGGIRAHHAVPGRQRGRSHGRPAALRYRGLNRDDALAQDPRCQPRRNRRAHHPRGAGLGIATVQAVSAADSDLLAARLADEVVDIGPPHATKSYLNQAAILRRGRARPAPTPCIRATVFFPRTPISPTAVEQPG